MAAMLSELILVLIVTDITSKKEPVRKTPRSDPIRIMI